jgi:hypothetical protein
VKWWGGEVVDWWIVGGVVDCWWIGEMVNWGSGGDGIVE